jgi:hypothetical protein
MVYFGSFFHQLLDVNICFMPILEELHVQEQDCDVEKWDGRRGNTINNASRLRFDP